MPFVEVDNAIDTASTRHHSRVDNASAGHLKKLEEHRNRIGELKGNDQVIAGHIWARKELLEVRALALGNCNAILFYNSKNHFIIYTILFYNTSTSQTSICIKILFF